MSKQRPSKSEAPWQPRVFRNSYTRAGRRRRVQGWSVKIQHQGIRRTCSLSSPSRAGAALEALSLYQQIRASGWESVPRGGRERSEPEQPIQARDDFLPRSDLRYWKRRLLRRRPIAAQEGSPAGAYAARLEHAGLSHYFQLRAADVETAASQARAIYQRLLREGWDAVNQRSPRELTLALHWADNPLAWTYSTVQTVVGPAKVCSALRPRAKFITPVQVVEPDSNLRRSFGEWVDQFPGLTVAGLQPTSRRALMELSRSPTQLLLINQNALELPPADFLQRVYQVAPNLPVLFYSVYEDSDQLFKATPGGASGYLLKRTPPNLLFDPIAPLLGRETLTAKRMAHQVRQYFQELVLSLAPGELSPDVARLTHREQEILNLLSKGFLDKEIADALRISVWTVHGHLKKIFEKLKVHTRTEAAIKYLQK